MGANIIELNLLTALAWCKHYKMRVTWISVNFFEEAVFKGASILSCGVYITDLTDNFNFFGVEVGFLIDASR